MLNALKFISFEIAPYCNLAKEHLWCPVNDPLRYAEYENKKVCQFSPIVKFLQVAVEKGFNGHVGFHYYTDPLVDVKRMLSLMQAIRDSVPTTKFILWTNGVLLDTFSQTWLGSFDRVMITLHHPDDRDRLVKITEKFPNVSFQDGEHDSRASLYDYKNINKGGCLRPQTIELPVNYYGDVRLCCSDYRGSVSIGNIQRESPEKVLSFFMEAAECAAKGSISVCWYCRALERSPVVPA
jgi:hypothetical protein